jgi:flavin reductase (DIM6/NTAB) family NADH-FMN oxidoreductase RutF
MAKQHQSEKSAPGTSEQRINSPSGVGPMEFRKALGRFASGVTIVTVDVAGEIHGMTAASFCSVSLDPPLVAVAIGHHAAMHGFLRKSIRFGVSILTRAQEPLSDHFAGRSPEGISFQFANVEVADTDHWLKSIVSGFFRGLK